MTRSSATAAPTDRSRRAVHGAWALIGLLALGVAPASAADDNDDLFEMDLETLSNLDIEVTSVSKRQQKASESPAAITVLTGEEIRRSGVTTIPDALRMVPGVQVAQIDANSWAIAIRGFNDEFSNKLLVLIDGRSVYTPLFGGVYWDAQDVYMEDIDRIEVIRGPGGAVWGANAVNGVINIITKKAEDTQGGNAFVRYGDFDRLSVGARAGIPIKEIGHARVYAKMFDRDAYPLEIDTGMGTVMQNRGVDEWDQFRGGVRADFEIGDKDSFTLQGDYYSGRTGEFVAGLETDDLPLTPRVFKPENDISGGNALARWNHRWNEEQTTSVQVYWDHTNRATSLFGEKRNTIDIEAQHDMPLPWDLSLAAGAGYRYSGGTFEPESFQTQMRNRVRSDNLYTGFLQFEWEPVTDMLRFTAGTKLEGNDFTGFEYQPSVRALFLPHRQHKLWAAFSRAVRTPTVVEEDLLLVVGSNPGSVVQVQGTKTTVLDAEDLTSERVLTVEAGYRFEWSERLNADFTFFYSDYNDLVTNVAGAIYQNPSPGYFVAPTSFINDGNARSVGFEISGNFQPLDWWRLAAYYAFIDVDFDSEMGLVLSNPETDTPKHSFHLRSNMTLPYALELDTLVYYVSKVEGTPPVLTTGTGAVDDYVRLDLRLAWHALSWLDVSVVGQNLADDRHAEFGSALNPTTSLVPRSVYAQIDVDF